MSLKVVKLKHSKPTQYENMFRQAMSIVQKDKKNVVGIGFFIKTKSDTLYDACGGSESIIVGSQLLARECVDYTMRQENRHDYP